MWIRLEPWTSLEKTRYRLAYSVVGFCMKISRHLTDVQNTPHFHCLLNKSTYAIQSHVLNNQIKATNLKALLGSAATLDFEHKSFKHSRFLQNILGNHQSQLHIRITWGVVRNAKAQLRRCEFNWSQIGPSFTHTHTHTHTHTILPEDINNKTIALDFGYILERQDKRYLIINAPLPFKGKTSALVTSICVDITTSLKKKISGRLKKKKKFAITKHPIQSSKIG